ncbi:MAG: hypothetical protein E7420_00630 [Ruminococcaceae bacterium]|nr:hypothetical protein [Oscillospiraceae bacterium]
MAKDLIDEDAIAETIYADYLARNPDIDVERDSFLGTKSRALAKEAGELAAVTVLQAVGVPWWLTTGVNAFGKEAENAARDGAAFDDAARSGLISAGAEIFTEAFSKGLNDKGKLLSDATLRKISAYISDDFVNSALVFGVKAFGKGAENSVAWAMEKFGQWLTYQDEETLREVLTSDEARKELSMAFWSGLLLKGVPAASNSVLGKNNIAAQSYDWGKGHYTPHLPQH